MSRDQLGFGLTLHKALQCKGIYVNRRYVRPCLHFWTGLDGGGDRLNFYYLALAYSRLALISLRSPTSSHPSFSPGRSHTGRSHLASSPPSRLDPAHLAHLSQPQPHECPDMHPCVCVWQDVHTYSYGLMVWPGSIPHGLPCLAWLGARSVRVSSCLHWVGGGKPSGLMGPARGC